MARIPLYRPADPRFRQLYVFLETVNRFVSEAESFRVNVGIQTFSNGKYLGAVLVKVWSGHAKIPAQKQQWEEFWETVEERGGLKPGFQWLAKNANEG